MKRFTGILIPIMMMLILLLLSCAKPSDEGNQEKTKVVPVEGFEVKEEVRMVKSSFIGTVQPGRSVQLSFKNGGRVEKVYVEKGDNVKKGDILAIIEKTDLAYAEKVAEARLDMAKAELEKASNGATREDIEQARLNVVKAEDAYQYAVERFAEVEELYAKGTASKQSYDQAKLERDIRQSDLKLAQEMETQVISGARYEEIKALSAQVESAQVEYEYRKSQLADAELISGMDGAVMEVAVEAGEMAGAGYPVVILRNDEKSVYVGVPEKELEKITMDTDVMIEKGDSTMQSNIKNIADIPDESTGLYNIEISVDEIDIPIGAGVTVSFLYGQQTGFYIPITAIHSADEDFIHTVTDGTMERKTIMIDRIDNFEAKVQGLKEGDFIITSGSSYISVGDAVMIKEDVHGTLD